MAKKNVLPTSTVVGYLRVSTADQNLEKNKADILQLANQHDLGRVRFVEETISGKISWRQRKIAEVLDSLRASDAIVVSELSRLGRSMLEYGGYRVTPLKQDPKDFSRREMRREMALCR